MVVYRLDRTNPVLSTGYDNIVATNPLTDVPVPHEVLHRERTQPPDAVLAELRDWRTTL